jgi:hypothetical protein
MHLVFLGSLGRGCYVWTGREEVFFVIRVHLGKLGKIDIARPTLLELVGFGGVLAAVVLLWVWR